MMLCKSLHIRLTQNFCCLWEKNLGGADSEAPDLLPGQSRDGQYLDSAKCSRSWRACDVAGERAM